MHREGEREGIAGKDLGGAVALVDVAIDHQRARDEGLGREHADGHRDVVENAETGAVGRMRVVAAARGVAGDAVGEREVRGRERAAHGGAGAGEDIGADGQADAAHRRLIERLIEHRADVSRRMGELDPRARRRLRLEGFVGADDAIGDQHLEEACELGHREAVALGQRRAVRRVMDDRQAHGAGLPAAALAIIVTI